MIKTKQSKFLEELKTYKLISARIAKEHPKLFKKTASHIAWYPASIDDYVKEIREQIVDENIVSDKEINNIKNLAYEFQSLEFHLVLWSECYYSHVLEVTSKKNIIESVHAISDQLLALSSKKLYSNKLNSFDRIEKAKESNIIDADIVEDLHKLRKNRNKIHLFEKETETETQSQVFSKLNVVDSIILVDKLIVQIYRHKSTNPDGIKESFFFGINKIQDIIRDKIIR